MGYSSRNITVKHSQVTSRKLFSKSFRTEENVRESIIECSSGSLCSWSKYRKVDELVEALGMKGIDKSEVSRISKQLDEFVEEFKNRRLEGEYPLPLA